ncbi:hypothetical protein OROMI_014601 [Orobanche minor]
MKLTIEKKNMGIPHLRITYHHKMTNRLCIIYHNEILIGPRSSSLIMFSSLSDLEIDTDRSLYSMVGTVLTAPTLSPYLIIHGNRQSTLSEVVPETPLVSDAFAANEGSTIHDIGSMFEMVPETPLGTVDTFAVDDGATTPEIHDWCRMRIQIFDDPLTANERSPEI